MALPRRVAGLFFLTVVLILAASDRSGLRGQAINGRLTTVLADLVQAVPQDDGRVAASPAQARPFAVEAMPRPVQDAVRGHRLRIDATNTAQVYILVSEVNEDIVRTLTAYGVTVEIADPGARRVQARVPISRLQIVAALPFVDFVRLPTYAVHRVGSVTTEGDAILAADVARQQFGVDGTGIKVGVISDGIKGVFATGCQTCSGATNGPIARGDLPAATGVRGISGILSSSSGGITGQSFTSNKDLEGKPSGSCGFAGAGAEGTALLEVVHDLAPGAQLAFANADTDLAFNQAVNALAAANDVVVDDLGFYGEPSDGSSAVSINTASALNNATNRIRAYITSVGNAADEHYLGGYVSSGVDGPSISGISTPGHLHLFQKSGDTTDVLNLGDQPYNLISLPNGGEVVIFLTWNDPSGHASSNYDLYLVRQSSGAVVARSTDNQSGSQDALEAIDFTNTGATDMFRIVVQNVRDQAPARTLNLFSFQPECANDGPRLLVEGRHERHNFNTASRSLSAQSDAGGSPVSVISVGAICSGSAAATGVFAGSTTPDESCNDRAHATIEFFSSQGPTLDGRVKPDVTAIDGVAVTAAGSFVNPFFGTSAAAPHVAGIAALALQGAPCLVSGGPGGVEASGARASLRGMILSGAQPLSDASPDNIFGAGLASAFASVQRTLPAFTGDGTVVIPGNISGGALLGAAQVGYRDPNQCLITRLKWTGGCGSSPGSTLNCPFGTTDVSVAATNNDLSFSAPADVHITVTSFGVAAAPGTQTIAAGQSATYVVTLTAEHGAFPNNVSLTCAGLPAGSRCTFDLASLTPGETAATTTLTISTTTRAGALSGFSWFNGFASLGLAAVLAAVVRGRRWRARFVAGVRARTWTRGVSASRVRSAASAVALAMAIAFVVVACGGGKGGGSTTPPPSGGGTGSVSLSAASVSFASQIVGAATAPQTITLMNTGATAVTVGSVSTSGDFGQTSTCSGSIAAGASCLVSVTFTPTTTGARTGTLTIADNATGSPHTAALTGTGVSATAGTPSGTYAITIAGASGALVQTGMLTLIVQ